jgi:DNA-binding NarL/FixJ family response regulator
VRVVVIDDHPFLREAIREVLVGRCPHAQVVAESDTARDAAALVQRHEADVLVLDLLLPGMSGITALREIRQVRPSCRVLVLTALREAEFATDALAAGATGYALKTQVLDELVFAICQVAAGKRYVAPGIETGLRERGDAGRQSSPLSTLSPREREIFDLVVSGYSNERLSRELFISIKTVETHRSHINRKLGVHSTAQLIRYALLQQMITDGQPRPDATAIVAKSSSLFE